MQFTPQQTRSIDAVGNWYKNFRAGDRSQPIFRLFGYAGTGKTTIASHFAEMVDGNTAFAAFTGKATHVLGRKGCPNAQTIHQLIYVPKDKSRARLRELIAKEARMKATDPNNADLKKLQAEIAEEQKNLKRPSFNINNESFLRQCSLLCVDECSMVDESMALDLMSFGVPILALGDPAQLPPVAGAGYFTNAKPDFMLTDIRRQARDNPIIEMSRIVREGGSLKVGMFGDSQVVRLEDWDKTTVFQADQLLVGRNDTRHTFNSRYRFLQGRNSNYPLPGDKLVCLRNNHELRLLNGSLWTVEECVDPDDGTLGLSLIGEEGEKVVTTAHACIFNGEEPDWHERKEHDEFNFGYALTVHKAQGSQWDNVFLFDEWRRADRAKWLYTGITRAAEKITVIKM